MDYHIARDGNSFGPYTEPELRAHLATGHIVPTDLARTPTMDEWLPLPQVLPAAFIVAPGTAFPNPPNLPWWLALILEVVTLSAFFFIWDIVEAYWIYRVNPRSRALLYYFGALVLFLFSTPDIYHSIMHAAFDGPIVDAPYAAPLSIAGFCVRLLARFSFRQSLLDHFNRTEPIGLRLSRFMTLLFGGLYFQYHFNRINEARQIVHQAPA